MFGLSTRRSNLIDLSYLKDDIIINKQPFGYDFLNKKQKRGIPPEISQKRRTKRRRGNKGKRKK